MKPEKYYNNKIGYWRKMCKDYNPVFLQKDLLGTSEQYPEHYAQGKRGGHPSAEGHIKIADKIIELIDAI